jgi:hypothetical protein
MGPRSTGIDRTCVLEGMEGHHRVRSRNEHDSVVRGFDRRTCRHRMRAGLPVLAQHILCVTSGYMIHYEKLLD